MLDLVDTHAHLDDPKIRDRLTEILRSAWVAGVSQVVAVGTTAEESLSVVRLARAHPGVYAAVGIHPNEAGEARPDDWAIIEKLAGEVGVVALGETGLDRHWARTPFEVQCEYFNRHLELSARLGLPVIIHSRDCHPDVVEQLRGLSRSVRGVLHSFTGNRTEVEQLLDLGLHISFAGMLTFSNKSLDPLREAAASVPLDRLLVETDSPYLSPHPFRGRCNEPSRVTWTAQRLAEIRGLSPLELSEITSLNARRLFALEESPRIIGETREVRESGPDERTSTH